jgi:hypothetical protein
VKRCALLCLLATGIANASTVKAPKGWTADTQTALSLSQQLGAVPHFGGLASIVTVEAYSAKGAVLYATRVMANVKPEQRDVAASAELDDLRASLRRQSTVAPTTWKREAIDGRLEATLAWREATANESRMIVVADAQHVVAVSGECVLAADVTDEVASACRAALATLDPDVPAAQRVALTLAAETAPPPPMPAPGSGASRAPSLGEASGDRPALAPIQITPQASERDRRPIYVGGGLVVLALVFWWNRKRREKLEQEYEDRVAPAPARERSADADADDLHAAATDDTQDKS